MLRAASWRAQHELVHSAARKALAARPAPEELVATALHRAVAPPPPRGVPHPEPFAQGVETPLATGFPYGAPPAPPPPQGRAQGLGPGAQVEPLWGAVAELREELALKDDMMEELWQKLDESMGQVHAAHTQHAHRAPHTHKI